MGTTNLPLLVPAVVSYIHITLKVVPADIPALLGLDALDLHFIIADTVPNRLAKKSIHRNKERTVSFVEEWRVSLRRTDGHVYVDIAEDEQMFFTAAQPQKLYGQFLHLSASKLYILLKKARLFDLTPATLDAPQELTRRCDACQKI